MFMFLMFALIDLVVIGIFYAVYGKKRKYSEGMLLGVHLPLSAAESGAKSAHAGRKKTVTSMSKTDKKGGARKKK